MAVLPLAPKNYLHKNEVCIKMDGVVVKEQTENLLTLKYKGS